MANPHPSRIRVALVGGETLLGREIQEVLKDRGAGVAVTAYAASGEGNFGEDEGEAVYLEPLSAASAAHDRAILVAGSPEGARKAYELAKSAGGRPAIIDGTGYLDNQPEAQLAAPLLHEPQPAPGWLKVIAHPAACAVCLVLKRLARYKPVRQCVLNIFEPASERGKRGVSELHQQTTSLLSFKPLEKHVFDAQVSFNLLSQYGEDAPAKLSATEQKIERHVATLLSRETSGTAIPMPSLRVVQVPVFHGYSISMWTEFATDVNATAIEEALASAQIEVRGPDDDAPDTVAAVSQSGLIAGDIRVDRNNSRAAWAWVVCDNLRLTADAAADLVSSLRADQQ